jgi:hypothetical protein
MELERRKKQGHYSTINQRFWRHICKTAQTHANAKFHKRATKPTHQDRHKMTINEHDSKEERSVL